MESESSTIKSDYTRNTTSSTAETERWYKERSESVSSNVSNLTVQSVDSNTPPMSSRQRVDTPTIEDMRKLISHSEKHILEYLKKQKK